MSRAVYLATPGGICGQGGIGRMALYLARTWGERCPDVPLRIVDTYGPGSKLLMPLWFTAAFLRVAAAGLLGRIAVLHVNVSERGSFLRKGLLVALARVLRTPIVLHCHGADLAEDVRGASPWRRRLIEAVFASSGCVLVLGEHWRAFVVSELGLPADKVRVLWNAVPDPGQPTLRTDGTVASILFLGRLGERKGVPELLTALADPQLRVLPWQATLAGDGPLERYRAMAESLGLSDRVTFTGWIGEREAKERLAAADLLVLPSRNEGLPVAILEAMSHGVPVVATPVGAVTDAVRDGRTGLLVPPSDANALARALERLVGSPSLRRTLGAEARDRFLADFSLEAHTRQLRAVYGSIAAAPLPLPRAA
jgi:glycosyltransferase involved in cell wall biosynthesis